MIDEEEWGWLIEHSLGDFDHLVIASTLPVFTAKGIHHLEAWKRPSAGRGRHSVCRPRLSSRAAASRRRRQVASREVAAPAPMC